MSGSSRPATTLPCMSCLVQLGSFGRRNTRHHLPLLHSGAKLLYGSEIASSHQFTQLHTDHVLTLQQTAEQHMALLSTPRALSGSTFV